MMMKDWSMGVRAGLNRADAEFESAAEAALLTHAQAGLLP